jgi:hypothetical protein
VTRGWWQMHCWNGLSEEQQTKLIEVGNLEIGYRARGTCERPAEVEVATMYDLAPGPRFYCVPCALAFLASFVHRCPRMLTPPGALTQFSDMPMEFRCVKEVGHEGRCEPR